MEQEQNRAPETPPAGAPAELPFGEPLLICPGLYRVRVPLPHNPLQALNSYIVLGDETTTIIDVGFNHPACEKALDKALESLGRTWARRRRRSKADSCSARASIACTYRPSCCR